MSIATIPCMLSTLATIWVLALAPIQASVGQGTETGPVASRRGHGDTSLFAPLTLLPAPTVYRSASGAPGSQYWQNRADYTLHATLDTAHHLVSGHMTLRYTNHSPDTLAFLWFQTEQNIFRSSSLSSLIFPPDNPFSNAGGQGGDVIERVVQVVAGKPVPLLRRDHGTLLQVPLARPLAPGQVATLEADWHFLVPDQGTVRMGRAGSLYEIAQWYPRVCVYDDLRGWNTDPYLGQGEFYLEYGNYTLSVTVPAGYLVAATGTLVNPHAVLTPTEIARLQRAATSAHPLAIVTAAELTRGAARPTTTGMLTWTFRARQVRDAVFAASPEYQWDAVGWHGVVAQAFYRPSAAAVWGEGEAADQARQSIQEYSDRWFPYPYPQVSVVEGPVYGMEYPMVAMESEIKTKPALYHVLTHEVGHNWFPMLVGSNERMHAWMDEGFNEFINTFSEARRYPAQGNQLARAAEEGTLVAALTQQGGGADIPIEFPPDRMAANGLGVEYLKTSVGLQLLRQEILGPELFDEAFRTYIHRWAYKHPTPADFFRTLENVAGRRLDWFWREWFYENPHFDQAVDSVETRVVGDTQEVTVQYGNRGGGVLPLHVQFTFTNGTTQDVVYPTEVWSLNSRRYVRQYRFVGQRVTRIVLDPERRLVDDDRANNVWTARP